MFEDEPVSESPIPSAPPSPKAPPKTSTPEPKPVKPAPAHLRGPPTSVGPKQPPPQLQGLSSAVADAINSHVDSLSDEGVAKCLDTLSKAVHGLRQTLHGHETGAGSMAESAPPTKAPAADHCQAALAAPPRPLSPPIKALPVAAPQGTCLAGAVSEPSGIPRNQFPVKAVPKGKPPPPRKDQPAPAEAGRPAEAKPAAAAETSAEAKPAAADLGGPPTPPDVPAVAVGNPQAAAGKPPAAAGETTSSWVGVSTLPR